MASGAGDGGRLHSRALASSGGHEEPPLQVPGQDPAAHGPTDVLGV